MTQVRTTAELTSERRPATAAGATAARFPWASLESAAKRMKWRLADTGTPGRRSLALPGGAGEGAVLLDPRLSRICYRLPLGSGPPDYGRWTGHLAAAQRGLTICRLALTEGVLSLVAESPVHKDAGELAAHLRLLRADLAAGRAVYEEHCESDRCKKRWPSVKRRPRAVSRKVRVVAEEAVTTWLQDAVAFGWQTCPHDNGWRLIRATWAPPGLPPICNLVLTPTTLVARAAVPLRGELAQECREALGLFLLRQNARLTVRLGLEGADPDADTAPEVRIEAPVPLAGLEELQVTEAVAAVCAGYGALRREIGALCNSHIAYLYILCQTQGSASPDAPPANR